MRLLNVLNTGQIFAKGRKAAGEKEYQDFTGKI